MNDSLRQQIIDAACHHFASRGFYKTTTAHIAHAVGVTQPYIYHFFKTKERLYLAAIDQALCRVVREITISETRPEKLYEILTREHRDEIHLIMHCFAVTEPAIREHVAATYSSIYTLVTDRFKQAGIANARSMTLQFIGSCLLWSLSVSIKED